MSLQIYQKGEPEYMNSFYWFKNNPITICTHYHTQLDVTLADDLRKSGCRFAVGGDYYDSKSD